MHKQTAETYWAKVKIGDPNACWEWQGALTSSGYGNLSWHGVHVQAHRVAFWLTYGGDRPATKFRHDGWAKRYRRFVLHRCDNRKCCNPNHLFLGSMATNQKDAYTKGRKTQPKSAHTNAKLTGDQVRYIRAAYAKGDVKQTELAAKFSVSQRVISMIVRNETYKDVI